MPYSCIIICRKSKIDNINNCKINNNNDSSNVNIIMMLDKDIFFCLVFANSREQNDKE